MLQRKCACGGSPGLDGECGACRRKRLLGGGGLGIQPKLAVNQPGDPYEQEADRVAEAVMRVPAALARRRLERDEEETEAIQTKPLIGRIFPVIQRQAVDEEEGVRGSVAPYLPQPTEKYEETLRVESMAGPLRRGIQRQAEEEGTPRAWPEESFAIASPRDGARDADDGASSGEAGERVEPDFQVGLDAERGGGRELAPSVRQFMEARFGVDFGGVRVHADERSAGLAADIHAQAFTIGNDVYFGAGYFAPESPSGRQLLAHELVHTLQQDQGRLRQRASREEAEDPDVIPLTAPGIQRQETFSPRDRPKGTRVHSEVLPAFGDANPDLFTEVKIPGAKKYVVEKGKAGIADFYMAPTTVAVNLVGDEPVYLEPDKKLRKGKAKWTRDHEKEGAPIGPKPGSAACDGGTGTEKVCRLDKAPKTVLLGDLKPGGSAETILGEGQINDYIGGLWITSGALNEYIDANPTLAHPASTHWDLEADAIPTLTIPPKYDFATATTRDEPLGLYAAGRRSEIIPGLLGRLVVYKAEDVKGIWAYEWVPTSIPASLRTGRRSKEFVDAIDRIDALIANLRSPPAPIVVAPKRSSKRRARRRNNGRSRAMRTRVRRAAPRNKVQRKKGDFDHRTWQTEYEGWRKRTGMLLEGAEGRDTRAMAALVDVQRRSGLPIDVPASFARVGKEVSKLEHWSRWGGVYGRLRRVFGSLFVKVSEMYNKARDKFRELTRRRSAASSGGDSLTKTIIRVAFGTAQGFFSVVIDRVVGHLKTALEKGAGVLVNEFFGEENVEKLASAKADLEKMVVDLQGAAEQKVEAIVEEMVKPYEEELAFIADVSKWVGDIGKIVNTIRWAARVINCATPPGVGCLKILLQAAGEKALEMVVESCWFQENVVVPLFNNVDFFRDLPGRISGYVIEQVKEALPLDDALKAKLFPSTAPPGQEIKEGDIPCDGAILSEEQLAMARLYEQHGEEKVKLLIAMMEKAGIGDEQVLKLVHIAQMDQVLSAVSQAEVEAAIQNYDRSKAFGIVGMDELAKSIKATAAGEQTPGPAEAGGEGGPVVSADEARYDGTKGANLSRTRIKVDNPLWEHVKGSEPNIDLAGYVDKAWVKTITDVPARVTRRVWKPSEAKRDYLAAYYKLKQGVRFDHNVPGVPAFVLAEGNEISGYLEYQPEPSKSTEQKEMPATNETDQ